MSCAMHSNDAKLYQTIRELFSREFHYQSGSDKQSHLHCKNCGIIYDTMEC